MKVLGLMRVRDGEELLLRGLDSLAQCCDAIFVINDRSIDRTGEILRKHPAVANVFTVDPAISHEDWFFSEPMGLNLLYRMTDFYLPDWVICAGHDQTLEPAGEIKTILSTIPEGVAGIQIPFVSVWDDPEYPLMVPLMGRATARRGRIWRYFPGLQAGTKPLHTGSMPANLKEFGTVEQVDSIVSYHYGYNTLRKRIAKVDRYQLLDPRCEYNLGVPYDRGLLFGYERGAIKDLLCEYRRRFRQYQISSGTG